MNTQVAKCVEIGLPELILLVIFAMVCLYFYACGSYSHFAIWDFSLANNCLFPFCSNFCSTSHTVFT